VVQRRTKFIIALCLLAAIGGLAWILWRPREPVYQGKRLSHWLEHYDGNFSTITEQSWMRQADEAIRQIGTNAIPILLERIAEKDSALKKKLLLWSPMKLQQALGVVPARMRNSEGRCGFEALGTNARCAVPALIRIYDTTYTWRAQYNSLQAIGEVGIYDPEAVSFLISVLESPDAHDEAIRALCKSRVEPQLVMPILIKELKDPTSQAILEPVQALGRFGPEAKAAVPLLIACLANKDPIIRRSAGESLKQIDAEAAVKAGVK
jgi:HEAT repeat protein